MHLSDYEQAIYSYQQIQIKNDNLKPEGVCQVPGFRRVKAFCYSVRLEISRSKIINTYKYPRTAIFSVFVGFAAI